jgi:UDP-N-acetylmuramate dehydrogenase
VEIREQVGLAGYTTFGIGGVARYFATAKTQKDVADAVAWAADRGIQLSILGGGSNLLVADEGFDGLVLHVAIPGIEYDQNGRFVVGAGESWDGFVTRSISENCAGIECLAGIPGSVGGTPVQNVGAYGQEVSETIESVRVFDRVRRLFVHYHNAACKFRYRESVFNTTWRDRYIVTRVRFTLRPGGEPTLKYADLQKRFTGMSPTLLEVSKTVREIRQSKGMLIVPGDADSRSAGSFFKNPIVTVEVADRIVGVPQWPAGEGLVKLPAAWLLEQAGFVKGYGSGPVRIASKHTLALTNRGGATFADVVAMQEEIVAGVEKKFGVRLQREPVVLG